MALQYTKVNPVKKGDKITSAQWNQLAKAFNDRFLGGVGDPTYRLHWYAHSVFRAMRMQDGSLFAPEDEWWYFYSHIKPGTSDWPVTGAGDPQGANPNNPFGTFIFGNESLNLYNEAGRLNYDPLTGDGIVMHDSLGAPVADVDHWVIGKYQRGVTDSTGADLAQANALVAAQHHLRLKGRGPLHMGYGGFLPSPAVNGYCNEASQDGELDIALKFTKLADSTACIYSTCQGGIGTGTCPGTSKSVLGYGQSTDSYVLFHHDGSISVLPFSEYLEGPYTGVNDNAVLSRKDGDQLSRAINAYINDFRGSAQERVQSDYNVKDKGFEFEEFFTTQHYLAPAFGVPSGYGAGALDAIYPQFDWTTGVQAGYGLYSSQDYYDIHAGFVCAGFIALGENLTEPKTFYLEVDGAIEGSITIDPTTDNKSHWFKEPKRGRVRIRSSRQMFGSEECYCEIAEILERKPSHEDAYLVLRMASANGTSDDGDGQDTPTPKDISTDYFRHGMIYNPTREGIQEDQTHVNRNPIYENFRRVVHDRLRLFKRMALEGYEVVDGKSVLYFARNSLGVSDADMWDGIGPSLDPVDSGEIRHNVKYIVESGTTGITYDEQTIAVGAVFTGAKGVRSFEKLNGDEVVKQYDGIIETAGVEGTDNRWSMFLSMTGYQPAEASEFKPDGYGDVIGWGHDRCVTFSPEWRSLQYNWIQAHVAYSGGEIFRAESPSGYRYLESTHTPSTGTSSTDLVQASNNGDCESTLTEEDCAGVAGHYKSCQVYVPDYEIESVVMSGSQVKVTMKGRLRHNDTAPASVTNSSAGWDSYLGAETGARSDENAVIEYLRWHAGSGTNCLVRVGDWAPGVNTTTYLSRIKGACLPRFYFTRQIPKVWEDGNTLLDSNDTRMVSDELVWLDLVLRAICEGYIDEEGTNQLRTYINELTGKPLCYEKRLFDYTYPNLMFKASENRWPVLVPLSERPDNPKMYGPLPTVLTYAEHFNQVANAVNLLYRARLYLPVYVEERRKEYRNTGGSGGIQGDGNCFNGAVWADGITGPFASTLVSTGSWVEVGGFPPPQKTITAEQRTRITDVDGNCALITIRVDKEFRFKLSNISELALPDDLKTLVVTDNSIGFAAAYDRTETVHQRQVLGAEEIGWGQPPSGAGNGAQADYYTAGGLPQDWVPVVTNYDTQCIITNGGTLTAPHPPPCDHIDTWVDTSVFPGVSVAGEGADTSVALTFSNLEAFVKVPVV